MDQNTNTNTFSIRTYDDDIKGNPSQSGNITINQAAPAMQQVESQTPPPPQTDGPPPLPQQPPGQISELPSQAPTSPQPDSQLSDSITGTPAVPDMPQPDAAAPPPPVEGRAGLASSAMKSLGGKSRTKLYIGIGAIVIIFILIMGGIYLLQSSSGDGILGSIKSLLGFEEAATPPENETEPETEPEPEETGDKLINVEKVIPNTYGYYIVTKKGSEDTNGMTYDMIQDRLLETTFTAELFSSFEIDQTNDFIWNTEELYFVPDSQEMPSHNADSKDGLLVMSIDYVQDAADFFNTIKESSFYTTEEDTVTGKEILGLKNETNATLYMVEFEDYLLMSPDKTVITNSLDLVSKSNSSDMAATSDQALGGITTVTSMHMIFSDNLQNQLSATEKLSLNFREKSFSFPASIVNWQSFGGIYLFAVLEDTKINYTIAIDKLTEAFQGYIPQWEQESFTHLQEFYSDITLSGTLSYENEAYKGFFKRYVNLADFGSPREATISYVVMDDIIFIGTTQTVFDKTVDAHLNTNQTSSTDNDSTDTNSTSSSDSDGNDTSKDNSSTDTTDTSDSNDSISQ